jgi:hypothetical protein
MTKKEGNMKEREDKGERGDLSYKGKMSANGTKIKPKRARE